MNLIMIRRSHLQSVFSLILFALLLAVQPPPLMAQADSDRSECMPAEGEPIRIGAVFPRVELFGADGPQPYRGVQNMVQAINQCGGGRPLELVYAPANNRDQALEAVETLRGQVPLVIGSGSGAVSQILTEASADGSFVYWEVTEPLDHADNRHEWAFSPRASSHQLGRAAAHYALEQIPPLIDGREPRIALLYEDRASLIAEGVLDTLQPQITRRYSNTLGNGYDLAARLRDERIDVVIIATFERDASYFWWNLRRADANIAAWIQVGSRLKDTCDAFAAITIGADGAVDQLYRPATAGAVYERYHELSAGLFGAISDRTDLAASGVYLLDMLLNDALASDDRSATEMSSEEMQQAIVSSDLPLYSGLMGEGLDLQDGDGDNAAASVIVQQRQWDGFCTVEPGALATCTAGLQSFPTWRERAVAASQGICGTERKSLAFQFPFANA